MVWEKMSKSKHNGVDPEQVVQAHGADAVRLTLLFAGPPDKEIMWTGEQAIQGSVRFLKRVWTLVGRVQAHTPTNGAGENPQDNSNNNKPWERHAVPPNEKVQKAVEDCISKVSAFIGEDKFNVAIAEMMKLTNTLTAAAEGAPQQQQQAEVSSLKEPLEVLLRLLAPFAPYFTQEAWMVLRSGESVHTRQWPLVNNLSWRASKQHASSERRGETLINVLVQLKGKRHSVQHLKGEALTWDEDTLLANLKLPAVHGMKRLVVKKPDSNGIVINFY